MKESDLHTKRTGHTEFVDKTLETVKPISLEAPKVAMDMDKPNDSSACGEAAEGTVPTSSSSPGVNPSFFNYSTISC